MIGLSSFCIAFFICLRRILAIRSFLQNFGVLSVQQSADIHGPYQRLAIIIPILNEERGMIEDCMRYFSRIAVTHAHVYFVSSAKEGNGYGSSFAVIENAIQGIFRDSSLRHVYCTETIGHKGGQVQFCINCIDGREGMLFGVYDIDSRPDLQVVDYLCGIRENAPVYQQYSIYDLNFDSLSYLCKAGALQQSFWSIAFEASFALKRRPSEQCYLVGHGLFIRGDTLDSVGGFLREAIAEDLMIGYKLSELGVPFTALHFWDHATFADGFWISVKQTSRWFAGELEMFKFCKKKGIGFYKRFAVLMLWPFEPVILTYLFVMCIFDRWVILPVVIILALLAGQGVIANATLKCSRGLRYGNLMAGLGAIVWNLASCIGPLLCLYKTLFKRDNLYYKTEKTYKPDGYAKNQSVEA
jgi:cellulose synthase/poly-beta-1,6-N-acetylglucosamine synthase-like glycosyltransferase